tara:strand:+ start:1422 stop:1655 length:234 start_codon:yes stop_codon:yes gene_type:complete
VVIILLVVAEPLPVDQHHVHLELVDMVVVVLQMHMEEVTTVLVVLLDFKILDLEEVVPIKTQPQPPSQLVLVVPVLS